MSHRPLASGSNDSQTSLGEAIARFEQSALMRETLGDHVFESLVANKKIEWDAYQQQVTRYELDRYLGTL